MRASCRRKDRNIYSRYMLTPNTNEFVDKVCAMKVLQLVLPLHPEWLRCIQPGWLLLKSDHIRFFQ
jgi:hypothetical protein